MRHWRSFTLGVGAAALAAGSAAAEVPAAIAAPGETAVATFHAEGAQLYECKAGADGKLAWTFREPIASLFLDGKTVGRHYAGPNWEHTDGSAVVAKVAGNAPGKTPNDIAWLKLEALAGYIPHRLDHVRQIEQHAAQTRCRIEDCCEKMTTAAADVRDCLESGEVVGGQHGRNICLGLARHSLVEQASLFGVRPEMSPDSVGNHHLECRLSGSHGIL